MGHGAKRGEGAEEESVRYINEKENRENISGVNIISNTLEPSSEQHYSSDVAFRNTMEGKLQINGLSDLDLHILEMIEKSDGVWQCKVCGKSNSHKGHMQYHAETHIEGMSHACHICNKSYPNRHALRSHIDKIHSELLSCDLCGKSGMNKSVYHDHKRTRQHKTLSGTP